MYYCLCSVESACMYCVYLQVGSLYERLVGGVAGTMVRQSQITGVLMGYSQARGSREEWPSG